MNLIAKSWISISVSVAAILLTFPATGQPWKSQAPTIPDHVCLPSLSEEDAAWNRLQQELNFAFREFDAVDAPAKAAFKAEEKALVMALIKRKKELDDRYETAYKLTQRLNPVRYSCDKAELHSPALVSACHELATAALFVRVAGDGECRNATVAGHEASVKEDSPCAAAVKRYWTTTSDPRSKYQERTAVAQATYTQSMLPACSLWQRITFKELDRATFRARQECVIANISPALVAKCTHAALNRK
jgi:hypothetical protein